MQSVPKDLPISYTSNLEAKELIHIGLSEVSGECILYILCIYLQDTRERFSSLAIY